MPGQCTRSRAEGDGRSAANQCCDMKADLGTIGPEATLKARRCGGPTRCAATEGAGQCVLNDSSSGFILVAAPEPDDVERKCPRRTRSLNSQHTSQNSKAKTVETLAERRLRSPRPQPTRLCNLSISRTQPTWGGLSCQESESGVGSCWVPDPDVASAPDYEATSSRNAFSLLYGG